MNLPERRGPDRRRLGPRLVSQFRYYVASAATSTFQPFLGTGEAAQGPTAAAIANALADAAGVRVRGLPLTAQRVKAAIGI